MFNLKERLLSGWLGEKVLKEGRVLEVEAVGPAYRCMTIEAPALRDTTAAAGDKVQVFLPGVGTRTYTPFNVQKEAATFQLLAYVHGVGPGSAWAARVAARDELRFVGPQTSLPFASMSAPVALFGDETSLPVARALMDAHTTDASFALEVDDMKNAREVCTRIGLSDSALVKRASGNDYYATLAQRLAAHVGESGTLVLTGSAQSIQRMRAALRALDRKVPQKTKAYWSQGKAGLD